MRYEAMLLAGLALTTAAFPAPAQAQQEEVVWEPATAWTGYRNATHQARCRAAHAVLATGTLGAAYDDALERSGTCGPVGGADLAHQLELRRATQTPGDALEKVVMASRDVVDSTLWRSALMIARDADAGTAARVGAIRVMYMIFRPGSYATYAFFASDTTTMPGAFTTAPLFGAALPATARSQTAAAMRDLADGTAPAPVREAASKLLSLTDW